MAVASVGYIPVSPASMSAAAETLRGQTNRMDMAISRNDPNKARPQAINSTAADLQRLVFDRKLQFVVDHNSNQVIVKVIDKETDKVIKELPPEELQRMHNNLKETIGFLFDERV